MDGQPIASHNDPDRIFQTALASYGAPAYVRRAHRVEAALTKLLNEGRKQRDEWAVMVGVHLVTLGGLAGTWDRLLPLLADVEQVDALDRLWEMLQPEVLVRIEPTTSERRLRRELEGLVREIEAFNRRWAEHLPTIDVTHVNRERDGFNRWYVLEKECAVRSMAVARQGFVTMAMMTRAELEERLPLLPVPRMAK
jgi:hypothetical protein